MRINIGKNWQKKLALLPETGMGSQHVDFFLMNGRILEDIPVFNGIECEVEEAFEPTEIKEVRLHQN
jgi:hypothetical protein